jgi:hypothetical protein
MMPNDMPLQSKAFKSFYGFASTISFILLFSFFGWWTYIQVVDAPSSLRELFSASYGVVAFWGALLGFGISGRWGGLKSAVGKALFFFSLGLLFQVFGQAVYSYYSLFLHVEIPYPSLGDVGYFGSVILYIYGSLLIAKVTGIGFSLKTSFLAKLVSVMLPLAILAASYFLLIRGVSDGTEDLLTKVLNFGYPLGQAVYLAITLLAYFLSKNILGGIMKDKILLLLFALTFQYVADFMFIYLNNAGVWTTAGLNELTYLVAYFVMAQSLLKFGRALYEFKDFE